MKKNLILCLAFVLLGSAQVSLGQDAPFDLESYRADDYSKLRNCADCFDKFSALAGEGSPAAQFILAKMYSNGWNVAKDDKEAAKWYRLSAEQGNEIAQLILGGMYYLGEGVPQDYKESVKWYRLAAEQGDGLAQYFLGLMYRDGEGVIQDNVYAHMWFNIAAAAGDEGAIHNRDVMKERMTRTQIGEAQRLARECVAKDYKGC